MSSLIKVTNIVKTKETYSALIYCNTVFVFFPDKDIISALKLVVILVVTLSTILFCKNNIFKSSNVIKINRFIKKLTILSKYHLLYKKE